MSLDKAIELAKANPIEKLPRMAALIYDKRLMVSYGLNQYKTHPLQAKFGRHEQCIHLHAEIAAIVNAKQDIAGLTMFIARVLKNDKPALARPCTGCMSAIMAFGLGDVHWTE